MGDRGIAARRGDRGAVIGRLGAIVAATPGIEPLVEAFLPVFYVPPRAVVQGLVLSAALGLASGALPAVAAMRLRIVDALRRT